jgi:Copper type II ascorbate-dependent monooxygenase, C-terminal domain
MATKIGRCVAPSDRYIGLVTGHFHEFGTRFSVWHENLEGENKLVYETYDWENPGNAYYSNRTANPEMNPDALQWGASSGFLHVKKGETVSFQCEFDNPGSTTVTLGETGADQMCNVFGMYFPSDGDNWNCSCLGERCF